MKIESTAFTTSDLQGFGDELIDHERMVLADRLERASDRLARAAERVPAGDPGGGEQWNAREVLAHIAVLSKFYGMLTYKVGTGQLAELDLLGNVHLRDVLGQQLAAEEPARLAEMAIADHRRTAAYLRSADAASMRRECVLDGGRTVVRADDLAREVLIGHLELHVEQLEQALRA